MSPMARDRGVRVGVMALEDSSRVDFVRLRSDRRAKVFAGMAVHGLDALILGGAGNVHYVTGARVLGRAGVLPFAPVCVVVRSTGRVHLLSTWDEGVPPEIEREDLYPLQWNPRNLMDSVAAVPGLRESRRVGTDGTTVSFGAMLESVELVDGGAVLAAARRIKTDDEITCLEVAAAISESALSVMSSALRPGITERELLGVYSSHISGLGAPVPPSESVCFATPSVGPVAFRHLVSDRVVGDGELVVLAPGALYAGYEAGLARTFVTGSASAGSASAGALALAGQCAAGMEALVGACRAGGIGADLYRAASGAGLSSAGLLASGLGLGAEPPAIGFGRGHDAVLEEGMVLSVQSWVAAEGVGGCLERATVVVGARGPLVLTRFGRL